MRCSQSTSVKAWAAVTAVLAACAILTAAGIAAVCTPAHRSNPPEWVPIAALHSVSVASGVQKIPVAVSRTDAWFRGPDEVIGYVFVKRSGNRERIAFRATYHLGSSLEFDEKANEFFSLCWNDVRFDAEGRRLHSIYDWGDLRRVRTDVVDDVAYVKLSDVMDDGG